MVKAVSVEDEKVSATVEITITPKLARTFAVFADGGRFSETQDQKLGENELLDAATDYQLFGKYYDRQSGNYEDIPAEDCTFRSSNTRVASVDKEGNLTTGKSGSADIYVSWCDDADGGRMQTVKIKVKVAGTGQRRGDYHAQADQCAQRRQPVPEGHCLER